jgi:hypothetical protein
MARSKKIKMAVTLIAWTPRKSFTLCLLGKGKGNLIASAISPNPL